MMMMARRCHHSQSINHPRLSESASDTPDPQGTLALGKVVATPGPGDLNADVHLLHLDLLQSVPVLLELALGVAHSGERDFERAGELDLLEVCDGALNVAALHHEVPLLREQLLDTRGFLLGHGEGEARQGFLAAAGVGWGGGFGGPDGFLGGFVVDGEGASVRCCSGSRVVGCSGYSRGSGRGALAGSRWRPFLVFDALDWAFAGEDGLCGLVGGLRALEVLRWHWG